MKYLIRALAKEVGPKLPAITHDFKTMPIGSYLVSRYHDDPFASYAATFIADRVRADAELSKLPGLESFAPYGQFSDFVTHLGNLHKHLYILYNHVVNGQNNAKFLMRETSSRNEVLADLKLGVDEYVRLLEETKEDAFWHKKIRDDIGQYVNLLYSAHESSPELDKIYEKVDRQDLYE